MKYSSFIFIPSVLFNAVNSYNCPKPTDSCRAGFKIIEFTNPSVPPCWLNVGSHWVCYAKIGGICNEAKAQIDISKCNNTTPTPQPQCPTNDSMCSVGDIAFKPTSPNAPPCWTKTTSGWSCSGYLNDKCDATKGQADLKGCNITPPTSEPQCPTNESMCLVGDIAFKPTSSNAPPCWAKSATGTWTCSGYSNGKCDTIKGQSDLKNCNITPPTPAPECPKATDFCLPDDVGARPNEVLSILPCWTKPISNSTFSPWKCVPRQNNVCDATKGEVDLKNCNITPPPKPECPKKTDTCKTGDIVWVANNPNAPRCWAKTASGWNCTQFPINGCDATKGQANLNSCFNIPPPLPGCPTNDSTCLVGDIAFKPTSPNAPPCWFKSTNDTWTCFGYSNGKCDTLNRQIDLKGCNIKPPVPVPTCPKATDTCKSGDIVFQANSPNAPPCWTKAANGWTCSGYASGACDASKGEADLKDCNITPLIPVPECPKATDTCKTGDIVWSANSPNAPPCWYKSNNGWSCVGDVTKACDASKGQLNIKTCNITLPIPIPQCPKPTEKCSSGNNIWQADSPTAPQCWSKTNNGWSCINKVNNKCDATKGQLDISTCEFPKPPNPTCPNKYDYCYDGYYYYYASDSKAPSCWGKTNWGWSCNHKRGACNKNQVDLTTCFKPPTPPVNKCPARNDKCYDSYGRRYNLKGYGTPRCWSKSNYGWSCRNAYGSCNIKEIDVKNC